MVDKNIFIEKGAGALAPYMQEVNQYSFEDLLDAMEEDGFIVYNNFKVPGRPESHQVFRLSDCCLKDCTHDNFSSGIIGRRLRSGKTYALTSLINAYKDRVFFVSPKVKKIDFQTDYKPLVFGGASC